MIKETHLQVEKTARIFSLGEINDNTEELILITHGYAMLASYFLGNFECISQPNRVIIAPEGLSKFYWNGFGGKVRASWMTSEDRESEIKDYIKYLDKVVTPIIKTNPNIKITAFGFSQGAATITRWLTNTNIKVNRIILWAGGFPLDCIDNFKEKYPNKTLELVIGDEDEFINEEAIEKTEDLFKKNNINYSLTRFKGKHTVDEKTLLKMFKIK